ncbi:MAG: VOC family protein [Ideonella sp.]|nr:VOC family protein [Ideonella sp.]MCC7457763.1 VOC family protein [Nitrospira sp.]
MTRIRPSKFVHVAYRTRRFDAMVAWYAAVFDARVQHRNPALAFLTYDDEHHRFAFANLDVLAPGVPEPEHRGLVGVEHLAYTLTHLQDLFDHYEQMAMLGIRPYWCIHHGVTVSMYYADPDGNQIEFQVECFASADEANAFMSGAGFAANPIGVEFDPDDWLARLRSGTPSAQLLPRRVHLPVSPLRGALAQPA